MIVITGASTGIGRATALKFARMGATVVLTARREQVINKLAEHCENYGTKALAVAADITDAEAVKNVARKAVETYGKIDVWVNNAAVIAFGKLEDTPLDVYKKVIETNLFGYIHGAKAVLPYFREQQQGILINISSMVAKIGAPYLSAYAVSKCAVSGLSNSLRMEVLDMPNIEVCSVLPASIDTPLFQQAANYSGRVPKPMNPVYSADQVADTIAHLVEHPEREVMVGNAARTIAAMHATSPVLAEKMYAKQVDKDHFFQDRTAPASAGNLFQPAEDYHSVSGGWLVDQERKRNSRKAAGSKLISLAALGVGVGLLITRVPLRLISR